MAKGWSRNHFIYIYRDVPFKVLSCIAYPHKDTQTHCDKNLPGPAKGCPGSVQLRSTSRVEYPFAGAGIEVC